MEPVVFLGSIKWNFKHQIPNWQTDGRGVGVSEEGTFLYGDYL